MAEMQWIDRGHIRAGLMADIIAIPVEITGAPCSVPEVIQVDFDLSTLRMTLSFPDAPSAYLTFTDSSGIHFLGERELDGYCDSQRPPGWLWEIHSGGWNALESKRVRLTNGYMTELKEFLVVGLVDCIGVLSPSFPVFSQIEP
jgi:hypothetical protein